jgi:hypothetical protein
VAVPRTGWIRRRASITGICRLPLHGQRFRYGGIVGGALGGSCYRYGPGRSRRAAVTLAPCHWAGQIGGTTGGSLQGIGGPAVNGSLRQPLRLLDDVSEFMAQQPVAAGSARPVCAGTKQDMSADGQGLGL